ncbi:shikimate dehydrogenase [archaeon SCG-AAA382B04]|nr:shikimate dehydrogenase [archaeon SCG-AAA382B04]
MRLVGLIGDPVEHSLSPEMHNVAMEELGVDGVYVKKQVEREELGDVLKGARLFGFSGLNVTIPYKESVLGFCDELGKEAELARAVNTLDFCSDGVFGYNTDVFGARQSVLEEMKISGSKMTLVGAGGGARACCVAFKEAKQIDVVNRTKQNACELVNDLERDVRADLNALGLEKLEDSLVDSDLLVNATSVGLESPQKSVVDKTFLHKDLVVFDLVYRPPLTKLLRDAEEVGCEVISGVEMLVKQGAKSFKIWLDREPNEDLMRRCVLDELNGGDSW